MPVRSHAMPAVLIKVTQIELYGRERAPTDAGRVAVAPPALGIEEELVAGVGRDGGLGAQPAPQPVAVEVGGCVRKQAFRQETLIEGPTAGSRDTDFRPPNKRWPPMKSLSIFCSCWA